MTSTTETVPRFIGRIYKITNCHNDLVYIGSTKNELQKRLFGHRSSCKEEYSRFYLAMVELNPQSFSIGLLEELPNTNGKELKIREFEWIAKYPADKLYNSELRLDQRSDSFYEKRIGHTVSEETRDTLSKTNGRGGSICLQIKHGHFTYEWRFKGDDGKYKRRSKSFGFGYGFGSRAKPSPEQAFQQALDFQKSKFPDLVFDAEQSQNRFDMLMAKL